MDSNDVFVLMDKERISRSLNRMGHEIAEKNIENNPVILFGINNRGYAIADELADILRPIFDQKVKSVQLPLKIGDDDEILEQLKLREAQESFLIAVDDVIFSGQTMFTALKKIINRIDPSEIHTAVLVDRGHRKFPIKAEFCGMSLPTKLNEHVSVVVENKKVKKVILKKNK